MFNSQFHIIMPFSRRYTKDFYIERLRPHHIIWHPVSEKPYDWPNESWIQPLVYDKTGMQVVTSPYFALNKFVNATDLVDNDYYFMMSDDDFIEPEFFNKIRHARKYCDHPESFIDTDFIVVTLMRGHNRVPTSGYPNDVLQAHPRNMRVFWVSLSQVLIKGRILKETHTWCSPDNGPCADGVYIQKLWDTYPGSHFTFVDDACQWFNYLEPGRWNGAPILDNYSHISNM